MMGEPISLRVIGDPTPQGSKKAFLSRDGKARMKEQTGAKLRNWRSLVADAARAWIDQQDSWEPLDEPCELRITFWFPLPQTDQYRSRHASAPDAEKLVRSVTDSLTAARLWRDDSRAFRQVIQKLYAHGGQYVGADITVIPHGQSEADDRERLKDAAKFARRGASARNTT